MKYIFMFSFLSLIRSLNMAVYSQKPDVSLINLIIFGHIYRRYFCFILTDYDRMHPIYVDLLMVCKVSGFFIQLNLFTLIIRTTSIHRQ